LSIKIPDSLDTLRSAPRRPATSSRSAIGTCEVSTAPSDTQAGKPLAARDRPEDQPGNLQSSGPRRGRVRVAGGFGLRAAEAGLAAVGADANGPGLRAGTRGARAQWGPWDPHRRRRDHRLRVRRARRTRAPSTPPPPAAATPASPTASSRPPNRGQADHRAAQEDTRRLGISKPKMITHSNRDSDISATPLRARRPSPARPVCAQCVYGRRDTMRHSGTFGDTKIGRHLDKRAPRGTGKHGETPHRSSCNRAVRGPSHRLHVMCLDIGDSRTLDLGVRLFWFGGRGARCPPVDRVRCQLRDTGIAFRGTEGGMVSEQRQAWDGTSGSSRTPTIMPWRPGDAPGFDRHSGVSAGSIQCNP
jgi:hypothetical protein